jgi:hypothetical protein
VPDVLAEEMIRALGDARQRAAASPLAATGTGASAAGRVTLVVSAAGLVGCAVDPVPPPNRHDIDVATETLRAEAGVAPLCATGGTRVFWRRKAQVVFLRRAVVRSPAVRAPFRSCACTPLWVNRGRRAGQA